MHRAGVPRYLLTLLLGGLASTAAAEPLEPGSDEALLYYQRNDNAYVGWGLHLWNTRSVPAYATAPAGISPWRRPASTPNTGPGIASR